MRAQRIPAAQQQATQPAAMPPASTPSQFGGKRAQNATDTSGPQRASKQARSEALDPATDPQCGLTFASQRSTDLATNVLFRANVGFGAGSSNTPAPARLLRFPSFTGAAWHATLGTTGQRSSADDQDAVPLVAPRRPSQATGRALLSSSMPFHNCLSTAAHLQQHPATQEAAQTSLVLPVAGMRDAAAADGPPQCQQAQSDTAVHNPCPGLTVSQRSGSNSDECGHGTQSSSGGPALAVTPPKLERPSVRSTFVATRLSAQPGGAACAFGTAGLCNADEEAAEHGEDGHDANLRVVSMPAFQGAARELCSPLARLSPTRMEVRTPHDCLSRSHAWRSRIVVRGSALTGQYGCSRVEFKHLVSTEPVDADRCQTPDSCTLQVPSTSAPQTLPSPGTFRVPLSLATLRRVTAPEL